MKKVFEIEMFVDSTDMGHLHRFYMSFISNSAVAANCSVCCAKQGNVSDDLIVFLAIIFL